MVSTTGVIGSCEGEARVHEGTGVQGNHHCPEKDRERWLRSEEVVVFGNISGWRVEEGREYLGDGDKQGLRRS